MQTPVRSTGIKNSRLAPADFYAFPLQPTTLPASLSPPADRRNSVLPCSHPSRWIWPPAHLRTHAVLSSCTAARYGSGEFSVTPLPGHISWRARCTLHSATASSRFPSSFLCHVQLAYVALRFCPGCLTSAARASRTISANPFVGQRFSCLQSPCCLVLEMHALIARRCNCRLNGLRGDALCHCRPEPERCVSCK